MRKTQPNGRVQVEEVSGLVRCLISGTVPRIKPIRNRIRAESAPALATAKIQIGVMVSSDWTAITASGKHRTRARSFRCEPFLIGLHFRVDAGQSNRPA